MFTGIVSGVGSLVESRPLIRNHVHTPEEEGRTLVVYAPGQLAEFALGASLAVNGVCLTATAIDVDTAQVEVEVMGETLRRTNLGQLSPGAKVNLERCVRASDRLDGHIVQGHVDAVGELLSRIDHQGWHQLRVGIPAELAPLTAEKGSIALDGVSLTITAVSPPPAPGAAAQRAWVEVGLIPATLEHTTFGQLPVGAAVNVEVDVLAKYAQRLMLFSTATPAPAEAGSGEAGRNQSSPDETRRNQSGPSEPSVGETSRVQTHPAEELAR